MSNPSPTAVRAALDALLAITEGVIDAVRVAGDQGVPGGVLYAALMTTGMTLERFEWLMALLVSSGRLVKRGQLYFYVEPEEALPKPRSSSLVPSS